MTLKQSAFGSKCALSDKFFKDTLNCGVLESILAFAQNKQNKDLKKTDGAKKARLTGISKLDDANEAGGKNGYKCTLIITEGDSAKALAVSGLSGAVCPRSRTTQLPLRSAGRAPRPPPQPPPLLPLRRPPRLCALPELTPRAHSQSSAATTTASSPYAASCSTCVTPTTRLSWRTRRSRS